MKQFAINTASNTLTAIALVGAMCTAAPAKADTGDTIKGLMFGLILTEVLGNNTTTQQPQTVTTPVITTRNPQNCGYFQNIEYQGALVIDTKFNRCTGELISQKVRPRY